MCAVQFEGGSLGTRFTRRTPPPIIPQCALPRRRNTKQEDKILDARLHVSHITVPVCRGAWFFQICFNQISWHAACVGARTHVRTSSQGAAGQCQDWDVTGCGGEKRFWSRKSELICLPPLCFVDMSRVCKLREQGVHFDFW